MAQLPQAQAPTQSAVQAGLRIGTQAIAPVAAPVPPLQGAVHGPTRSEIDESPWKYAGYPQFSRWVASDQAWFITRRFSTLNARIILLLQDNVVKLEEKLNTLDKSFSRSQTVMNDDNNTHNGSFRMESFPDRQDVLEELVGAVSKYNSFINEYSQLASRPTVRIDDVKAVRVWLHNHENAIYDPEAAYINEDHEDDLIPVHPKGRSWFRKVLEKTPLLRHFPLKRYLSRRPCDPLVREKDGDTVWHNDTRVERFSSTVVSAIGLGMIIGPIWALYEVGPSSARLGIISAFIVVFYILVGIATTARVFESLAAVAAYSAVLMVFMQIKSL